MVVRDYLVGVVVVSKELLYNHLERNEFLKKAYELLISDPEVQELLELSNVFAVKRLKYNDHGPVHAKIVAGAALELFERLLARGVKPSSIVDGTATCIDEARLIVMYAGLLHDIGNAIHRDMHERFGALLAKDIIDRVLSKIITDYRKAIRIRQEILHAIYATEYNLRCLSIEAGVVKVADGLDMAEGRARIPYRLGKLDMHAVSALSIKRVEIHDGRKRPISIIVKMEDMAGLFQIEAVLIPKIEHSGISDYFEVHISVREGPHLMVYPYT